MRSYILSSSISTIPNNLCLTSWKELYSCRRKGVNLYITVFRMHTKLKINVCQWKFILSARLHGSFALKASRISALNKLSNLLLKNKFLEENDSLTSRLKYTSHLTERPYSLIKKVNKNIVGFATVDINQGRRLRQHVKKDTSPLFPLWWCFHGTQLKPSGQKEVCALNWYWRFIKSLLVSYPNFIGHVQLPFW